MKTLLPDLKIGRSKGYHGDLFSLVVLPLKPCVSVFLVLHRESSVISYCYKQNIYVNSY